MNSKDFTYELISKYEKLTGQTLSTDDIGFYLTEIIDEKGNALFELQLTKRQAARICYEFMKNALKLKDEDWNDAGKLKDIYSCKVCANPIAQCYVRGIILPLREDLFGSDDIIGTDEAKMIVNKIMALVQEI